MYYEHYNIFILFLIYKLYNIYNQRVADSNTIADSIKKGLLNDFSKPLNR